MATSSIAEILLITIKVAAAAVLLAAPPAILVGFLFARRDFFGKSILETIVALPLVLPPTAIGYILLEFFAHGSPFSLRRLGIELDILFTPSAAILASAVMAFPLMTRTARAAFEVVDPRLEKMAHSLGISTLRTFFSVTIPLARRGLEAAVILGFGRAIGEFGATVIVAGNIPGQTQTLALAIFESIQLSDDRRAAILVGITVLIAFLLVFTVERLSRRKAVGR
jgi:molybdate transport system permease protein